MKSSSIQNSIFIKIEFQIVVFFYIVCAQYYFTESFGHFGRVMSIGSNFVNYELSKDSKVGIRCFSNQTEQIGSVMTPKIAASGWLFFKF